MAISCVTSPGIAIWIQFHLLIMFVLQNTEEIPYLYS
ncbi:hypothetical protein EV213_107189 [Aureibacillus halotolerans]|uniref:Uncharacterized protein n=1 Tax=Aureibacillus halotolerans TaxID=1508390 RepID=A0A4R6U1L0_9BACI|nr:hypothetical protein EV213_107189 [Aureibacillus halotolerans]